MNLDDHLHYRSSDPWLQEWSSGLEVFLTKNQKKEEKTLKSNKMSFESVLKTLFRNVTVFTQLTAILRERRVSIFSLSQGKMIHLTLSDGATGNSLLYLVAKLSCFLL